MSATPEDLRRRTGDAAQAMMDLFDEDYIEQMDNHFGPAIREMDSFLKDRGVKRPMRRQLILGWALALVDAR